MPEQSTTDGERGGGGFVIAVFGLLAFAGVRRQRSAMLASHE
ncbi:MAG: hypothetical protein R6X02_15575 [Enhygromyxa sp.]